LTASTNQKFDLAAAMKGQQWERAKGELRALVALQGCYHSATLASQPPSPEQQRLTDAGLAVEAFIKEFEDEGFHE
jgi:hypothetical protein